jgi:CotH kinase protein
MKQINHYWSLLSLLVLACLCNLPPAQAQNFFDQQTIHEVRINFPDDNWGKKLKALKEREPNRRIIGKVLIDGVAYDSVGVRYKGNSSYNNPSKKEQRKLPLNIKFDHIKFGQVLPGGISTLKLSNAFRDPSFVREPLAYEIARKYMPSSGSNFVKVFINDEYMGLYNNTESVDKAFITKHFGAQGKALFKCDPDDWQAFVQKPGCQLSKEASLSNLGAATECYKEIYEITTGDAKHYADLTKLIMMLDKDPQKLPEILNVDQVLWMLAFNNLFVNLDSYNGALSHNYYLFLDSLGHFHPILWDMNLAFGGFRFQGKGLYTNQELIEYPPMAEAALPNRPLASKLLVGDFNRKLYYHHMRTMLEDWVDTKRYYTSATQMQSAVDKAVLDDKNKLYTYEAFRENLKTTTDAAKSQSIGIGELMEGRAFYLKSLAEFKTPAPRVVKQNKKIEGDQVIFHVEAADAERIILMYRANKSQLFKAMPMPPVPPTADSALSPVQYGDVDGSVKLPVMEAREYYFVIEGDQSIATFPARASLEYLKL